jgi:hypothetical protein
MSNVRSQVPRLRITKNGKELCVAGSEDVWMFSVNVWADVWGPEVSSITVTGSKPSDEGSAGEFLVWHLAHELKASDRLQFSFLEGSESSPLDDAPIKSPSESDEEIDFFAPVPESELLRLEARPVENAACTWSFASGGEAPILLGPDLARQHVSLHLLWNDHRPERLRVSLSKSSLREISSRVRGQELLLEHLPIGSALELAVGT